MSGENDDLLSEMQELAGLVAAHLDWEADGDGIGVPTVQLPVRAAITSAAQTASVNVGSNASTSSLEDRKVRLAAIAEDVSTCTKCALANGRTKTVFARGNPESDIVFVGEGPGFNEDQEGLPFVGPAGQLLDKMIVAMGYATSDVYICNVVKCRPPENRNPLPQEMDACMPYLREQLGLISPKVIVALGRVAGQGLGCFTPEARGWRGVWKSWESIPVMPTYHPAFLLRSPEYKRQVWEDLQKVMTHLGKR